MAIVPGASAQWFAPWRFGVPPGAVVDRLEAQGFELVAPLQRRPGVYLADVRAGRGGFQRLVIDDRSGQILQRFNSPPGGAGHELAARYPSPAFAPPAPWPGSPAEPNGQPRSRSAYGEPADLSIPSAVSPYATPSQPSPSKLKPKSPAHKASPMASPPLPPPAPREAAKPEDSGPPPPPASAPQPPVDSPPGESQNASTVVAPATPEVGPEAAGETEVRPEAEAQSPGAAPESAIPAPPAPSADASERPKVNVVPGTLFE